MRTKTLTCLLIGLVGCALALGACGISDDDFGHPQGNDPLDPSDPTDPTDPTDPVDPNKTKPDTPQLDQTGLPATTCAAEVAIKGLAEPGAAVFAMGGASMSGISTDSNAATGSFCLPVKLKENQVNTIEVRVQDPVLGLSDPATVTVTHESCGQGDDDVGPGDRPDPRNVALGATGRALDGALDEGNEGFLTDGDDGTAAVYSGWDWYCPWCDWDGWVTVKLDKVYKLSKINVRWRDYDGGGSSSYGYKYKVLVSSASDPGDPNLENGYWEEVGTVTSGDGGLDVFDLMATQPLVQHVALWLQQDGGSSVYTEEFAVAEIEVWDAPDTEVPTPPTQSNVCGS